MNIKDFKWTEKRFGTRFANILKNLGGLSKDSTDGSLDYKDEQGNVTKLVTDSNFSSLLAKNGLIEVKWQELKDKRDTGKLIPGSLYHITDYNCTTTQENTRSAGHQFDIVLLALSEDKLAEEGWAMMHDNIYDVTFSDGVNKRCYINIVDGIANIVDVNTKLGVDADTDGEITINDENKTATTIYLSDNLELENLTYNYFQNSNLSAWKVWYCLDNDTARFAWADDSVNEGSPASISVDPNSEPLIRKPSDDKESKYAWLNGYESFYTDSSTPNIGDAVYYDDLTTLAYNVLSYTPAQEGTGLPNGRGVIYRLIDEWNNNVAYDFKNIQFVRKLTDGEYDPEGEDTWVYTISWNDNGTIVDATIPDGDGNTFASHSIINISFELLDNVFLGGASNCYVDCNSGNNTIINGSSIILLCCNELVCGEDGESAVYIANKKVLTEE